MSRLTEVLEKAQQHLKVEDDSAGDASVVARAIRELEQDIKANERLKAMDDKALKVLKKTLPAKAFAKEVASAQELYLNDKRALSDKLRRFRQYANDLKALATR